MFSQIVNAYHSIPSSFWVVIWSSLVLSGVVEVVKRLFVKDLSQLPNNTQVGLTTAVAFAAAGVQYLSAAAQTNPNVLGVHTAVLLATMHLAYTFVVKPFTNLLSDAKAYRQAQTVVPTATDGAAG
jgi:hypothetical protein